MRACLAEGLREGGSHWDSSTATVTAILAAPTWASWRAGLLVAAIGEAIRIWAAGHLEKGREVTRSGPYRWTAHPLYVGSSVMALGIVIAAHSVVAFVLAAIYMVSTLTAAVRTEEAFLRGRFGGAYDAVSTLVRAKGWIADSASHARGATRNIAPSSGC